MNDTDPSELNPQLTDEDRFFMRLDPIVRRLENKVDDQNAHVQKALDSIMDKMRSDRTEIRAEIAALSGRRNVAPWIVAASSGALIVSLLAIGIAAANRITLEVRQTPSACVESD